MIIGLIFGLASALMFKTFRSLAQMVVVEISMLFLCAYMSYVVAELFELSGIISLLTAGIMMAHYTWFNLSRQGRHSSSVVF